MHLAPRAAITLVCFMAIACSPAFDWRETHFSEAGVAALFPCRPAVQRRAVRLADKAVSLTLHVCSAGGMTWAVATVDVVDPTLVSLALKELIVSARANVNGLSASRMPFVVSGGTPNKDAVREVIAGRLPDGQAVVEHVGVFSRATWAVQVTALGVSPSAEAVATFFESIRVQL